uniref:ATP synthase F(1) complex subunit delta, mitochondrial n=1 Tax=Glossina brevipalpis TaxID=37001 RepID=A0A1A9WTD7_9MUSC
MLFVKNARLLVKCGTRLMQARGYANEMKLTFAAANRTFYDNADVLQIDVPSFSGSFGILANHVPTLAALKPGVVQVIENDGKIIKYFVSSGTVTVNEDSSVQVLAEEAHEIKDIDISEARLLLSKYQSIMSSSSSDVAKAEAAVAVECCEALIKAAE